MHQTVREMHINLNIADLCDHGKDVQIMVHRCLDGDRLIPFVCKAMPTHLSPRKIMLTLLIPYCCDILLAFLFRVVDSSPAQPSCAE